MSSLLALIGLLVLGLLAFLITQRIILAVVRRAVRDDVQKRTRGQEVLRQSLTANSFGLELLGRNQIRGNGALILTRQELVFIMAFPRRELAIPLDTITGISLPRSHLGKTAFRPLLRVDFRGPQGEDAVAFAVQDAAAWQEAIEEILP